MCAWHSIQLLLSFGRFIVYQRCEGNDTTIWKLCCKTKAIGHVSEKIRHIKEYTPVSHSIWTIDERVLHSGCHVEVSWESESQLSVSLKTPQRSPVHVLAYQSYYDNTRKEPIQYQPGVVMLWLIIENALILNLSLKILSRWLFFSITCAQHWCVWGDSGTVCWHACFISWIL